MTEREAENICQEYAGHINHTEEDDFLYTEALQYLIRNTGDADRMVELGAYYYRKKQYELAVKYYEMAAMKNNIYAISNLGYIYYYGRTGQRDYAKAYKYFDQARKLGNIEAAYKIADMYRNGYYVQQDYEEYKKIIEELYPKVQHCKYLNDPLPEIYIRLGGIRAKEGKKQEALKLYDMARSFLAQRIRYDRFFGNFTIMKGLIQDIYSIRKFDPNNFGLYDLFYVLNTPCKVRFIYEDMPYEVEAAQAEGGLAVRFKGKSYRSTQDFLEKAMIDQVPLTTRYDELYNFEVI